MTSSVADAVLRDSQDWLKSSGLQQFELERIIGKGSYGVVFSAFDLKRDKRVAVKIISPDVLKDGYLAQRILREICLLFSFRGHPNIMGLVDVRKVSRKNHRDNLLIVMDIMDCDLNSLFRSGTTLQERHAKFFIYQLLCGLYYIHCAGVIHRDVTPSNILVDGNCDVRLCDFGLATQKTSIELTDYVCQRWYRAPELVMEERTYTSKVDIWASGCILAQMFTKSFVPLFPGEDRIKQLGTILNIIGTPLEEDIEAVGSKDARQYIRRHHSNITQIDFSQHLRTPEGETLSKDALDLLHCMLEFNPQKRIDAAAALKHPYFAEFFSADDLFVTLEPCDMSDSDDFEDVDATIVKLFKKVEEIREKLALDEQVFAGKRTSSAKEESFNASALEMEQQYANRSNNTTRSSAFSQGSAGSSSPASRSGTSVTSSSLSSSSRSSSARFIFSDGSLFPAPPVVAIDVPSDALCRSGLERADSALAHLSDGEWD